MYVYIYHLYNVCMDITIYILFRCIYAYTYLYTYIYCILLYFTRIYIYNVEIYITIYVHTCRRYIYLCFISLCWLLWGASLTGSPQGPLAFRSCRVDLWDWPGGPKTFGEYMAWSETSRSFSDPYSFDYFFWALCQFVTENNLLIQFQYMEVS